MKRANSINRDGHFGRSVPSIWLLIISLILTALPLSACKKVTNSFPTFPSTESSSSSGTSETTEKTVSQTYELTIASPLSYETCQYLAKLYVAKSQGLLGEGVDGETVDLDFLSSIDLPFVLNVYGTSDTGCNLSTLAKWRADGNLPDIFLAGEFDLSVGAGYILPITDYLAETPLPSADRIYPQMLREFSREDLQFGIPYQNSVAVLYCDMEVLNQAGIPAVSYQQSKKSLENILMKINELNQEERVALPFYMAGSMMLYLPCSLHNSRYLSVSVTEDRLESSYRSSMDYVSHLVESGYTYESLNEEEIELLFDGLSPLLSRKVGVWTGMTDEILRYDNYMPNTLSLMQFPTTEEDVYSPPLLASYPLCVSSTCENPKEAVDLMTFMALDEDALLLTARLQSREGYLPSVSYPSVWKAFTGRQKYGMYLIQYEDKMDQAIYIPAISQSARFQQDLGYILETIEPNLMIKEEDQNE